MAQLDGNGDWDWVENLGSSSDDLFADITLNYTDIPTAFGSFQATINKGTQSVTSSAGLDLVIWSLDPINNADSDNDGVNDLTDAGVFAPLLARRASSTSCWDRRVAVGGLKASPFLGVRFLSLSGSLLFEMASRMAT